MTEKDPNNGNRDDVPPQKEPAATPLISVADFNTSQYPVIHIPENRLYAFSEFARRLADSWQGSIENHLLSKLGEFAYARPLGIERGVDTNIYTDGGDGGTDLTYRGATIDVKTVGQHRSNPALTVDAYEPLRADYYALASRISKSDVRLIGYAPRKFIANAPVRDHENGPYHIVDQRYLFPFPSDLI
jgi:hypothetical protein